MNRFVIIVAGGMGQRMQSAIPKQMLPVHGKAIIIHTIEKFRAFDPSISVIAVIHESLKQELVSLLERHQLQDVQIVPGGDTRFQSVKNGLNNITATEGIVGIHDAARPMVSVQTIERCYAAATESGNAIPVIALNESLREVQEKESHAVNRDRYKIVQTPQCFDLSGIRNAFEQPYSPAFTDDATVLESTGVAIRLVEGNPENIKITHPVDLQIAGLLLASHDH